MERDREREREYTDTDDILRFNVIVGPLGDSGAPDNLT